MTSMALTLGLRAAARAKQVQWMTRQWGTVLGCRVRPGHGDWPWLAHRGSSCIYVYVPYMIVGCLHKKQRKLYQIYCVSVLVSIPALLDVSLRQKFIFLDLESRSITQRHRWRRITQRVPARAGAPALSRRHLLRRGALVVRTQRAEGTAGATRVVFRGHDGRCAVEGGDSRDRWQRRSNRPVHLKVEPVHLSRGLAPPDGSTDHEQHERQAHCQNKGT